MKTRRNIVAGLIAPALLAVAGAPATARAVPDGDGSGHPAEVLVTAAFAAVSRACPCPEDEALLPSLEKCLKRRSAKAAAAFKTAVRFTGGSFGDFRTALAVESAAYVDECAAPEEESEEPEEDADAETDF